MALLIKTHRTTICSAEKLIKLPTNEVIIALMSDQTEQKTAYSNLHLEVRWFEGQIRQGMGASQQSAELCEQFISAIKVE